MLSILERAYLEHSPPFSRHTNSYSRYALGDILFSTHDQHMTLFAFCWLDNTTNDLRRIISTGVLLCCSFRNLLYTRDKFNTYVNTSVYRALVVSPIQRGVAGLVLRYGYELGVGWSSHLACRFDGCRNNTVWGTRLTAPRFPRERHGGIYFTASRVLCGRTG